MTITLTLGQEALIDDADGPSVRSHRWYAVKTKRTAKTYYAVARIGGKNVYLHRLLMGTDGPSVDHINGNGLDNRRSNLRHATVAQQGMNSVAKGGRSRFKGVILHDSGLWRAQIWVNGKMKSKYGKTELAAAQLYNEMASEYFGEFARLNSLEAA